MFNHCVSRESAWKHVPYKVTPPAMLPRAMQKEGCVLKVLGSFEELVPAALRRGCFLTKDQLTCLAKADGIALPTKGTGKNNNVVKRDIALVCVKHYFPDASPEDLERMLAGVTGGANPKECCPEDLLDAIEHLDPIAKEDFEDIKFICRKQRKAQEKHKPKAGARPGQGASAEQEVRTTKDASKAGGDKRAAHTKSAPKVYTPTSLQSLIPGRGELPGIFIKRLPGDKRKTYQAFYPGAIGQGSD